MKIEKLFTLSQYIDLIKEKESKEEVKRLEALLFIYRYNEFLKQPLTKEMFINDIPYLSKGKKFKEWIESEKKLIFKFKLSWSEDSIDVYEDGINELAIDLDLVGNDYSFDVSNENYNEETIVTLFDLAEKTNGELELKNTEI